MLLVQQSLCNGLGGLLPQKIILSELKLFKAWTKVKLKEKLFLWLNLLNGINFGAESN
jgi:hypothetical protein